MHAVDDGGGRPGAEATIWYMGVKTRLLDRLEQAIAPRLATGRSRTPVLLDLMCGTGVVGARFASRARVWATDVQAYACVLARSRLEPSPAVQQAIARCLDRAAAAREALERQYASLVATETRLLAAARDRDGIDAYCRWAEGESACHEPQSECAGCGPDSFPPRLVTAYYRNLYFGVRQAIELDALRWAIEHEPVPAVRNMLLAALLFAASRATSATAHFAQPRALGAASERARLVDRRRIEIRDRFLERLGALEQQQARRARAGAFRHRHRVERRDALQLCASAPRAAIDVLYADPPYTADNYSRFYHVLETLVLYDYPPLARRGGRLTRGRYPVLERRHRSPFCSVASVEAAFESVCRFAARAGAVLVWSYARTNGLLIREVYGGSLARFERLLGRFYEHVELEEVELAHSGAGSRALRSRELIAVCARPRPRPLPRPARSRRAGGRVAGAAQAR